MGLFVALELAIIRGRRSYLQHLIVVLLRALFLGRDFDSKEMSLPYPSWWSFIKSMAVVVCFFRRL